MERRPHKKPNIYFLSCIGVSVLSLFLLTLKYSSTDFGRHIWERKCPICLPSRRKNSVEIERVQDGANGTFSFISEDFNRYNKASRTLWVEEDVVLTDEVSDWWYSFVGGNFKKEDTTSILKAFYDNGGVSVDPRANVRDTDFVYKSCAVVGSSSLLLEEHNGESIDKHEAVFRFNDAPIKGFETYVGFKTTHRLLYPESANETTNYEDTILVLVPFKVKDLKWVESATTDGLFDMKSYYVVPRRIQASPNNVWIVHPDLMRLAQNGYLRNPPGKWPSTGMVGVILSLYYCQHVSVFGFGANSKREWGHYYSSIHPVLNVDQIGHNALNEIALLKRLHSQRVINFHFSKDTLTEKTVTTNSTQPTPKSVTTSAFFQPELTDTKVSN